MKITTFKSEPPIETAEQRAASDAPPFQLPTVSVKLVNPTLDLDRTSALIARNDETVYGRE
jgi:hypothetical protein